MRVAGSGETKTGLSLAITYPDKFLHSAGGCLQLLQALSDIILGLGVYFNFAWNNNNNNNDNNNDNNNNPHLKFLKATILWDKDQGVGIWDE